MAQSTVELRVESREAEMWKSRVNAITSPVHSWCDRLEQALVIRQACNVC